MFVIIAKDRQNTNHLGAKIAMFTIIKDALTKTIIIFVS